MDLQKLKTDFPDWEDHAEKAPSPVIKRLMLNLKPVAVINTIMYVDYIGPEDKKVVFTDYFKKELPNLEAYFAAVYKANRVLSAKQMDEMKLNWLQQLMNEFKPKYVHFNIYKEEK
jgi:hypothetical protein